MNVCRWCTPSGLDATEYLKSYASKQLSPEDLEGSNDDLCYCLECVVEYHKAREKLPSLHQVLLELETSRLIAHIEKSVREEAGEDDELFIVDENGETQLPVYVGPDFENNLRVPLLEVLKYPYLLLHEKVSELCVEVLCRMEESRTSFQVFEKYPGIYLFLVHPNEVIRRWAILTARNLGKVDRDDYYDLQEVLTCLFKVIELGLFESPDIYRSSVIEKGKLILLPSHLYDNTNYKNYWLGICMLLTVLEEQAMDSLLLGPDKQNDFMQSILHTMEKEADDDSTDPFWPALHCFMVILDQLGSKVWGQLIDPVQAFQTIINSMSYKNEIKNIRNSFIRTKSELKTDYGDEMVTCSQIVYTYNTEKPQKDTGWKTAICPDYCPNMYEDMQTLANVLQSDIGRDMRVHDSTFLWFIPFVQSLMDLKDLGVAYIGEVIHYLCSEIKDILNERIQRCDKVSEFFLLILVSIIELHRNKKCLHLLWISSQEWVEAVVRCAKLPAIAFTRSTEKAAGSYARGSSTISLQASNSVQHACVQLIRSLLREGYQIGQHALCKQYLDKLNLLLRGNLSLGWQLNIQETQELQICLKQMIRNLKSRAVNVSASVENNANSTALPTVSLKQEKSAPGDGYKMSVHGRENLCSPVAFISKEGEDGRCQDNSFAGRNSAWEEDCKDSSKNSKSLTSTDCLLVNIKKEPKDLITQECKCLQKSFAKETHGKVQENRNSDLMSGNCDVGYQGFNTSIQSSNSRRSGVLENKQEAEAVSPMYLSAQTSVDSPQHVYSSDVKGRKVSPSSSSEFKEDVHTLGHLHFQTHNTEGHSRLLTQIADLKNCGSAISASEAEQPVFCTGSSCMRKDCCKHQGVNAVGENEDRELANISRSSESTWEKSAFKYGLVSNNQEQKEMPLDCFSFAKNQPGMQGNKDNSILLANISDTALQNVSTKDDSSLLLKSVCLKDQEQPNLRDLVKCDRKSQISKTSCTVKNSVSGYVPSSFENKGDMSNTALPVSPVAIKCESSERLIVCSKYFKRENGSEGKEEEDSVRMVSGDNTLTNSQLDKDLSKLSLAAYAKSVNFPSQSSQESSMHNNTCDVKRKVKSAVRSSNDAQSNQTLCDTDSHGNKIIVILDSSDEENSVTVKEKTKEINENTCPEKQPLSEMQHDVTDSESESKMPNSPLPLEDCDSQYFEFETEVDVFSVWQDTQEYKQDCPSTSVGSSHSDGLLKDHTNEWGYDTDYVSDDAMEKGTNWTGEEINTSHQKETDNTEVTSSALQEFSAKENVKDELENSTDKTTVDKDLIPNADLTEPRASTSNISLASKLALKKSTLSPHKNIAKSKVARTIQRSPKATALNTTQTKKLLQSTLKKIHPGRTTPAVVPPKKARQCPAPTSTVEKLGLKKAPRKAFDLSQRSLDSLAQLRSYGKVAGKVGVAQRGKLKRTAHPSLSTQINKKMLACQDLQFLKQTRLSKTVRVKNISRGSEDRSKKASTTDTKSVKQKAKRLDEPSVEKQGEEKTGETFYPSERERITSVSVEEAVQTTLVSSCSDSSKAKDCDVMIPPALMDSSPCSAAVVGDAKGKPEEGCIVQPEFGMTASKENECKPDENSDDDDLFLTQLDPVDMELCSQDEDAKDGSIATTRTEEMEIDSTESLQQNEPLTVVKCKYKDCTEKVEKIGDCCSKHSATSSESDHLFAKPSSLPPRKPSTTKIFSSVSSSRNAAFSKDLENVEKQPQALKSRASVAKPAALRPPSEKATSTRNQTCKTPSSSKIPQPQISNNVLQPRNTQSNNASNISRRPVRAEHSSSFLGAQQHDHNIFVKEVLKWTYEMFANSMQFGPPNTLLQSVVASVPIRFQGYNDYFNTFFPLMMLNAFETLAQEWVENQKMKDKTYCFYLQNFCADLNTAEFIGYFEENDLTKQLHPKEDDLIFLVGQKKDAFGEDRELEDHLVNHVGLVRRFSRASGCLTRQMEHIVCHLSVQTRGNLSFFINNQVKCVVVGSLVPTQRSFKGLLLLSRSPLAKPIINPSYSDFCPRDLPVASENATFSMSEYNEDQKRAIETAYAMVKQHPGLAKICLIHGPPGTGKSKTIVGLLSRVLSENTRTEKTSKKNARMKQSRFLVCAPSNAAVDELMKKIIIAFKEKCQNKQEPLGNCGDIKLVRLGAERSINSEVRAFSLDKQVEHRMKRKPTDRDQDIQKKKAALDEKLDMLSRQRAMHRCEKRESQMLDDEIGRLSKERQQLASQLKEVRGHSQKVQTDIILESDIICCTLSTSGGGLLESAFWRQGLDPFSCVIVDEAGQSCEVETLIPLIHRCNKLVLVGDPRQLPPTIKSIKAQEYGYGQSLMARLQRHLEDQVQNNLLRRLPVVQLTVQYRMHPDICLFPSSYVYGRTLKTDKATEENRCSSEWPFQPYLVFDVGDGREERDKDSFSNPQEVKLVLEIIRTIKEKRKDLGLRRIGIITPYSAQKKKIQEELDRVFKNNSPGEVDTVDAFQGREKDCIIVTCVRANSSKGSIGFLASLQRLNVTITRARFSLFILGRLKTLMGFLFCDCKFSNATGLVKQYLELHRLGLASWRSLNVQLLPSLQPQLALLALLGGLVFCFLVFLPCPPPSAFLRCPLIQDTATQLHRIQLQED
uniref:Senataxin n=1 Tax=Meleagris gallopavo TaxID=9103 RepID=G1N2Q1_MELGA